MPRGKKAEVAVTPETTPAPATKPVKVAKIAKPVPALIKPAKVAKVAKPAPAPVKPTKVAKAAPAAKPAKVAKAAPAPIEVKLHLPRGVVSEQASNHINLSWPTDDRRMTILGHRILLTKHLPIPNFTEIPAELAKSKHYGACRSVGKVASEKEMQSVVSTFFKK